MTPSQKRYLLVDNGIGALVANFVLAGLMGWLMFRTVDRVPLWGQNRILGDTLTTCVLLATITVLVFAPLARSQLRAGGVRRIHHLAWVNRFPLSAFLRGLLVGVGSLPVVIPITLTGFESADISGLSMRQFLWFKAGFAACEGPW